MERYLHTGTTYRLILMDYSMPMMTGIEAGVKIKEFMRKKKIEKKYSTLVCCITAYKGKQYE